MSDFCSKRVEHLIAQLCIRDHPLNRIDYPLKTEKNPQNYDKGYTRNAIYIQMASISMRIMQDKHFCVILQENAHETRQQHDFKNGFKFANEETRQPHDFKNGFKFANEETRQPHDFKNGFKFANEETRQPHDFKNGFKLANEETRQPHDFKNGFKFANEEAK